MRHFLSGQLHWMALGVGILVLAGGISVSLWLSERDDGPAPALGAGETAPGQLQTGVEVPGLPARNSTGDGVGGGASPVAYDDRMSGSAKMDATAAGSGLTGGTDAMVSDQAKMDAAAAGSGLPADDDTSVSDLAKMEVPPGEAAPHGGGPGDVASVQDSAELVVRDASGKIKQRKTVK